MVGVFFVDVVGAQPRMLVAHGALRVGVGARDERVECSVADRRAAVPKSGVSVRRAMRRKRN